VLKGNISNMENEKWEELNLRDDRKIHVYG